MWIASPLGLVLLVIVIIIVGVIAVAVALTATMFRSAGDVDIKDDYLPPELAGKHAELEGAEFNLEVLADLGGAQFVLPDATRTVEEAQAAIVKPANEEQPK